MKLLLYFTALIFMGLGVAANQAFGCSCKQLPPDTNPQKLAELKNSGMDTIFEGSVQGARMKSPLLDAAVGSILPASLEEYPPIMSVTFTDTHFYKGVQKRTVQLQTGLGGGDCGFQFELKRRYLVYAYKNENGQLSTGICTETAPIEESGTNLAYLRGESLSPDGPRDVQHFHSGRLCGRIVRDTQPAADDDPRIQFVRHASVSPIPNDEAEPDEKGKFCADVDPGIYRLIFTDTLGDDDITSYVYYPGTVQAADATEITVNPGEIVSDVIFKIPVQETFSVSGVVSLSDNSPLPANLKIILISSDQPFQGPVYGEDVAQNGAFVFPRVLPGRYWALSDVNTDADSGNAKWSTIKTELVVNGNVDHTSLLLIRN